eukprot:c9478_g1_i3.p1 GENE.c9478_g1_i3~~c9478_g1_i3.p1  ORF type:complete len:230 (-),score=30.10 c9478_g1_i3:212-901(-)
MTLRLSKLCVHTSQTCWAHFLSCPLLVAPIFSGIFLCLVLMKSSLKPNQQQQLVTRYLVLLKYGGVYSDVDVMCKVPILHWQGIETAEFVVGVERDHRGLSAASVKSGGFSRSLQFCQWTMASAPGHPILQCAVDHVKANVEHRIASKGHNGRWSNLEVLDVTGPGPWSDCVSRVTGVAQDSRVGRPGFIPPFLGNDNSLILPPFAFGRQPSSLFPKYVLHGFGGSWRT